MAQTKDSVKSHGPHGPARLANLAICQAALKRAMDRPGHLPGLVVHYGPSGWGKSTAAAASKAGITYDVRMYDVRHLFASVLLTGGADLQAVSKLMGHASVKMTADQYYHLQRGEKQRAVSMLPKITDREKIGKVVKYRGTCEMRIPMNTGLSRTYTGQT